MFATIAVGELPLPVTTRFATRNLSLVFSLGFWKSNQHPKSLFCGQSGNGHCHKPRVDVATGHCHILLMRKQNGCTFVGLFGTTHLPLQIMIDYLESFQHVLNERGDTEHVFGVSTFPSACSASPTSWRSGRLPRENWSMKAASLHLLKGSEQCLTCPKMTSLMHSTTTCKYEIAMKPALQGNGILGNASH